MPRADIIEFDENRPADADGSEIHRSVEAMARQIAAKLSERFPASRVVVYADTEYLWLVDIRLKLTQCVFAVQCADCWIISTSWHANSIGSWFRSRSARRAEYELTMAAMLEVVRAVPRAGEVRRFGREEYEDRGRRRSA